MLRLSIVCLLIAGTAAAQDLPASVRAHAVRRSGPIAIDGHLDEPDWDRAPKQSGFTQRQPKDGGAATLDTRFAVLYDDEALYVGVWADDPEPHRIRALLTRRDVDAPADAILVGIDSYHDRRTAYVFQLNAAGVQRDMLLFDDTNQDDTWDAVWTGNTAVTAKGWTAEFRIPLNQLRFASGDTHEWGLQIVRFQARSQEMDTWSPWPRTGPQVVSKFGVVDGIDQLTPGRRLELLPYALGGVDVAPVDAGDPLNDHFSMKRGIGLDLKYGLGPAFTLSATINPDFGQVEADPSQVNLGPNELFFAEKRPFFLEGVDLFKLPIGNGDSPIEGAFYSRRIGAAPPTPDLDYNYIKQPESTVIYGAAKLTGKTRSGWSVGVFDAVTGAEDAELITLDNAKVTTEVAPLTNYAVARIKRDLNDGQTSLGVSATAVDRSLDGSPLASILHDQAYTGGFQILHRWWDNAWTANIHGVGSWVHGTTDAIATTQESNGHLFQRPDSTDSHFDPTRTSLSGGGLTWNIGRLGETKHVRFGFGGDFRSTGLELNDAGFQFNSDRTVPYVWAQYHDETPGDYLLNYQVNADVFIVSTLEPTLDDIGFECNANMQFPNYWSFAAGCTIDNARWSQVALRGGPALRMNTGYGAWMNLNTDNRRAVQLGLSAQGWVTPAMEAINGELDLGVTVQARSNIDLFLGPSLYQRYDALQYVTEVDDMRGDPHYIMARIEQTNFGITTRMNWTFSPHLALQVYAQPFVATGKYSDLKDVDDPHAERFEDRFHVFTPREIYESDGTLYVSRNGVQYSFDKPDFGFRQLRSTVVLRWEYRPGSNVYAIWSHGQTSDVVDGAFRPLHDAGDLLRSSSENLVMVKANYWIGL